MEHATLRGNSKRRHPPHWRPRIVRLLRWLRYVRGWGRLSRLIAPTKLTGRFRVRNKAGVFEGDIGSFIDRAIYCEGGYEDEEIAAFLSCVPPHRRGTILDVGANVGTHAIAFARAFVSVHAFEPNPDVCAALCRNVALNSLANVAVHPVGLADAAQELDFYLTELNNLGLGTFSAIEQYEAPLRFAGRYQVFRGDDYLDQIGVAHVDAIKIDVQGLEWSVLRGLRGVLDRSKPFIWIEMGFVEPIDLQRLQGEIGYAFDALSLRSGRLRSAHASALPAGDYVLIPR